MDTRRRNFTSTLTIAHSTAASGWISPLLPDDASAEAKKTYEEFRCGMGFASPPNFIMTQGHSPTVARGTWELVRNVLVTGKIERWIKELIFAAISKDRNCHYGAAAHIACCRMLGVEPGLLDSLVRDVNSLAHPKLRDMILFGLKCSRQPQAVTEGDYAKLRKHGLGQPEILELIAMSGLAVYANIMADATSMEEDAIFANLAYVY
jgi:uncharacterized peroxidase-related enzyme